MLAWRPRWPLVTVLVGTVAIGCATPAAPPTKPKAPSKAGPARSASSAPSGAPASTPASAGASPSGSAVPASPRPSGSVSPSASGTLPVPSPSLTPTPRPTPTLGPDGGRTLAGGLEVGRLDGEWNVARFQGPEFLAADASGAVLVADTSAGLIRRVTPDGVVTTLAGGGGVGLVDGKALGAGFNQGGSAFYSPVGLCAAPDGAIYIADAGNHAIRKLKDGQVTTVAGSGKAGFKDGVGKAAEFSNPRGVVRGPDDVLYVADTDNHRIRKVLPDGTVSTLAGSGEAAVRDGLASAAGLNGPSSILLEASGSLLILEVGGRVVRRVTLAGLVTTLAGGAPTGAADGRGASASFAFPKALAEEAPGIYLVADQAPPALRRVTADGTVTTVKAKVTVEALVVVGNRCYAVLQNEPLVRAYDLPLPP